MDQLTDESDEPRIASSRSKKHADKRKHKVRSRHLSSSSEEDQSSVVRQGSSKPSGATSDQDLPQHDPDPPYYREVALSDVPSQYAEEVDTFRHILSSPQLPLWAWMMKKPVKSSDLEVLPLCYHSAQLSKMSLISLNIIIMSADLSVSWHYVVTLRRGRTRPREQLLLQNYKA